MPKCTYCQKDYSFPKGMTVVMVNGDVHHFCSSKCRKNMKMGRRKVRWLPKNLKFNPKNKIKPKKKK